MTSAQHMIIKVITMNCWGIPIAAKDRPARMSAIGETLGKMEVDLIALQEVYLESDRDVILAQVLPHGLIYHHYFPSGAFGSGLFMISRFPFLDHGFYRYSLNGQPEDLRRGDYYGGKGLAWVRVETPLGALDFYDTHMIAPYMEIGSDVYYHHRVAQAYELAQWVNRQSEATPVILAGDLNCTPVDLPYRTARTYAKLRDSYLEAHPDNPGYTVSTAIPYLLTHAPERIDYVMYRSCPGSSLQLRSAELAFNLLPQEYANQMLAYSDHYGVFAYFDLVTTPEAEPSSPISLTSNDELEQTFRQGLERSNRAEQVSALRAGGGVLIALLLLYLHRNKKMTRRHFIKVLISGIIAVSVMVIGMNIFSVTQIAEQVEVMEKMLGEVES